jgi:hypothetical protein
MRQGHDPETGELFPLDADPPTAASSSWKIQALIIAVPFSSDNPKHETTGQLPVGYN